MKSLRNILPFLSEVALALILVATIPAETWHDCEHYHAHDESSSESQLLNDHQCEICDFHFSGFHLEVLEPVKSLSAEINSKVSFYHSAQASALSATSLSRAPPTLS